jgi:hypothetical protein
VVLLDEAGRGRRGRGALAGVVGAEEGKDAVEADQVFLLDFAAPSGSAFGAA